MLIFMLIRIKAYKSCYQSEEMLSLLFFVSINQYLMRHTKIKKNHSRIFNSNEDVAITGERLQKLTYNQLSWSLSSENSLARHIYSDTEH